MYINNKKMGNMFLLFVIVMLSLYILVFDIIIKQSKKIIEEFSFDKNVKVVIIGERKKIPQVIINC